jgi:hypothetical protein
LSNIPSKIFQGDNELSKIKQGGNKNRILYDGVGHHSIFL